MPVTKFRGRCNRIADILEEEVEKVYMSSPVPGKELHQKFYEGWVACCTALRHSVEMLDDAFLVPDARFKALIETLDETPTASERLAFKLAQLEESNAGN